MTNKKMFTNLPSLEMAKMIKALAGESVNGIVKWLKSPMGTMIEEKPNQQYDNINHPSHYTKTGVECIDVMISNFGIREVMIFCKLNAFKYLWRHKFKNGEEDLKKWGWYTAKYGELRDKIEKEGNQEETES